MPRSDWASAGLSLVRRRLPPPSVGLRGSGGGCRPVGAPAAFAATVRLAMWVPAGSSVVAGSRYAGEGALPFALFGLKGEADRPQAAFDRAVELAALPEPALAGAPAVQVRLALFRDHQVACLSAVSCHRGEVWVRGPWCRPRVACGRNTAAGRR